MVNNIFKKNKKIYIYISIFFIFILLLASSNFLVYVVDTKSNNLSEIKEISKKEIEQYIKDDVFFGIQRIEMFNNITRDVEIQGWGFVETEQSSQDREEYIILSNDNKNYKVKMELTYSELNFLMPDVKMNGNRHSFKGRFNTANIKNGVYKVYLYTKENKENYGIVDTGKLLRINNALNVSENVFISFNQVVNFNKIIKSGDINYYIENIIPSKNRLYVSGYGFLENDKRKVKIYVGITDKLGNETYYDTFYNLRFDIADIYGMYNAGFISYIPIKNSVNYEVTSLVAEDKDGRLYKTNISKENIHSNAGTLTEIKECEIINNTPIAYHIDRFINQEGKKAVAGWAYLLDGYKIGTVYIGVKDRASKEYIFETEQIRRPDLAKKYNNINLEQAGFRTDIELDNPEDYKLTSIYIKLEDKYYRVSPYGEKTVLNNTATENSEVKFNIDKFTKKNKSLSITGWSFLSDNSSESSVYIGVKDIQGNETFYTTRKISRKDVAENFGNDGLELSGFTTIIEYDNISDYKLSSLVLQDKGVNYKIDISDKEVEVEKTKNNNIKYFIDLYKETGNRLSIKGWAFLENQKTGNVILSFKDKAGNEKFYTARSYNRKDVVRAFDKNKDLIKSGFYTDIDFDNIGDYELSGIIIDNDGKYYRKDLTTNDVRVRESKVVNINQPIIESNLITFIASNTQEQEKLTIEGWGFLKGQKAQSKIYIAIMDKDGKETIYDTNQYTNKTVEEKYAGENIPLSGFRVNITTSNAEDFEASGIIIEESGKYYRANIGSSINNLTANNQINLQGEESNKNVKWFIDNLNRDNKSIYIGGWAFDNDLYKTGDILVGLKDSHGNELYYDTSKVMRNDVCWHVGNDNVSESGFSSRIDTAGEVDNYSLSSIVYRNKDDNKTYTKVDLTGKYGQETSIKEIEQGIIRYQIDTFENNKNKIIVKGYAYFSDDNQTGKVYIGLTDSNGRQRYYSTKNIQRPELIAQIENDNANNNMNNKPMILSAQEKENIIKSGFSTVLFIKSDANYKITSIIIEKDGKFYKRM